MPKTKTFTANEPLTVGDMNNLLQNGQIVQTSGQSTTDVMSQKATTDFVKNIDAFNATKIKMQNLWLSNGTNYGGGINFGDGELVYLKEISDDKLEIKATTINFVGNIAQAKFSELKYKDNGFQTLYSSGSTDLVYGHSCYVVLGRNATGRVISFKASAKIQKGSKQHKFIKISTLLSGLTNYSADAVNSVTGTWHCYTALGSGATYDYGTGLELSSEGDYIILARYYTTSGSLGGWELPNLGVGKWFGVQGYIQLKN